MSEQNEQGQAQTTEQKRQAILAAVEAGEVSGAKLEPTRKGATITKLRQGKNVKPATIDRLYDMLVALRAGGSVATAPATPRPTTSQPNRTATAKRDQGQEITRLQALVKALEAQNASLKAQIEQVAEQAKQREEIVMQQATQAEQEKAITQRLEQIEQRLAQIEQGKAQVAQGRAQTPCAAEQIEQAPEQVLGWRLTRKSTKTGGITYRKWYATRAGHVVYVGGDWQQAEHKIRAFCAKKGLDLC